MASRKDYYDILGIRRGATEDEIEKAYQKLARTYQSTPQPGHKTADFRFKEILEAYEILSNKVSRERYDRMGIDFPFREDFWDEGLEESEEEEHGLEGFEDLWELSFDAGGPGVAQTAQKGRDIQVTLGIDLESAVRGTAMEVQVFQEIPCLLCGGRGVNAEGPQRPCGPCGGAGQIQVGLPPLASSKECDRCRGTGKVFVQGCELCSGRGWIAQNSPVPIQIPPGVNDRCRVYLTHMGHMGKNGGPRGDLVAEIRVGKHPHFERKGDDLHTELPLAVWEAALGTEMEVPSLVGRIRVKIPPGIQPGEQVRIPQGGVPFLQGGSCGDQVLTARILVPRKVDEKSRKLFEGLKRHSPTGIRRQWGSAKKSKKGR